MRNTMAVVLVLSWVSGCDQGEKPKTAPVTEAAAVAPPPAVLGPFTAKAWEVIEPALMVRRTPTEAPPPNKRRHVP